jgi:hypothetical protein
MTHDHPGEVPAAGVLAVPVWRASWRAGQIPADFSAVRSDSGVRLTWFGPGVVSENSIISENKQPFMMDFSASGFTNQ